MATIVQFSVTTVLMLLLSSLSSQAGAVVKRESHQRPMKLTWVPVVEPSDLANAQSLVIGIQPIHGGDSQKEGTQDTSYGKIKTGNKLVMDLTPLAENKWTKYSGHNDENKYSKTRLTTVKPETYEGARDGDTYDDAKPSGSYQGEAKSIDDGRSQSAGASDESDDHFVPTRTFVDSPRDYEPSGAQGDERGPAFDYDDDRSKHKKDYDHFIGQSQKYIDTHNKFFMPEEFDGERAATTFHDDDDDEDEYGDTGHYSSATDGGHKDSKEDDYYGPLEEFDGAYTPNAGQREGSENYENSHKEDDEDGSVGGTSEDVQRNRNNEIESNHNKFKDSGVGFNTDSSDSTDSADTFGFIPKDITLDAQKYHIPKIEFPKMDQTPHKLKSSSELNEFIPNDQNEKPSSSHLPKWTDVADTRAGNGASYGGEKSVTIDNYEDPKPRMQNSPFQNSGTYSHPVPAHESTSNKKPVAKFVGDEVYIEPLHRDDHDYQRPVQSQSSQQSFPKSQPSEDPYSFPDEAPGHTFGSKTASGSNKENIQSSNSNPQRKPTYGFEQFRPDTYSHSEGRHEESRKHEDLPRPQQQSYEREQPRSSIPKTLSLLKPNFEHHPEMQHYRPQPKTSSNHQHESRHHDIPQSSSQQSQRNSDYDNSRSEKYHSNPQQVSKDIQRSFVLGLPLPNDQTSSEYTAAPTIQQAPRPPQHYSSNPQRQPTGNQQYQGARRPAPSRDYVDSQRYEKPQHAASAPRPTHHNGGLGIGIGFLSDIETPHKQKADSSTKQYKRSGQ